MEKIISDELRKKFDDCIYEIVKDELDGLDNHIGNLRKSVVNEIAAIIDEYEQEIYEKCIMDKEKHNNLVYDNTRNMGRQENENEIQN